jgi:hypothetical protein
LKNTFILIVILLAGLVQRSFGQYFQFIENRGQWDKSVKYKTDFKGGALFLKSSGYKVILHDKDDLKGNCRIFQRT